jgi:uncharacterized protein YggE
LKTLCTAAVLGVLAALVLPAARGQYGGSAGEPQRIISVNGQAEMRIPPDQASVLLGVEVRGYDVPGLRELAAQRTAKALNAVKSSGIRPADIQTTRLSVRRERWNFGDEQKSDLPGEDTLKGNIYWVRNTFEVRTSQLDRVGDVIDAAMKAGANLVQGPVFTLKDDTAQRRKLSELAYDDAKTNAETLAARAGVRLTGLSRVTESYTPAASSGFGGFGGGYYSYAEASDMSSSPTPVSPGEVALRSAVNASFTFEPRK